MTEREGRELAVLDAYVRSQLAKAAETYASRVDLHARLAAVLQAAEQEHVDPPAPDKLGAGKQVEPQLPGAPQPSRQPITGGGG